VAIIDSLKRHNLIFGEALKAWKWLRKQAAYIADYKRQQKLGKSISLSVKEELRKKYGFYPLVNPNGYAMKSIFPDEFFIGFGDLLGQRPFAAGAYFPNIPVLRLSYSSKEEYEKCKIDFEAYKNSKVFKKKYKDKLVRIRVQVNPNKEEDAVPCPIIIEVNPYYPINFILPEIRKTLQKVKKAYSIKDKRPRIDGMFKSYQLYVLNKFGEKRRKIKKIIDPFIDEDGGQESRIKRFIRLEKKVKKIETRKS
jgi:hypothetical protein